MRTIVYYYLVIDQGANITRTTTNCTACLCSLGERVGAVGERSTKKFYVDVCAPASQIGEREREREIDREHTY